MLPLPLMLLVMGIGLGLIWFSRFQKTGKVCISLSWLALLLLSLQPVADRLLKPLEDSYPTWQGTQKWSTLWCWVADIRGIRSGRQVQT